MARKKAELDAALGDGMLEHRTAYGLAEPVPATPVDAHLRLRVRAMAREIIDQAKAGANLGTIQRLARDIEHAMDTA